jgi:hypothetical protein
MSVELNLVSDRRRDGLPPLALGPLHDVTEEDVARALQNWRDRMVSEYASARVFGELCSQMIVAGVGAAHVAAVTEMAAQEIDHARACARVVSALGGVARAPMPHPLPPVPAHEEVSPLEGVLRNVLSISCCSETVAVALVGGERELAATPDLCALLERILADEVKHARFGWRLVRELAPTFDAAMRERLSAYLVVAFEHQLSFHAPFLVMGAASDAAVGIGAPDGPANWEVFMATIATVTVPGLEQVGLGAASAWREAQRRVAA